MTSLWTFLFLLVYSLSFSRFSPTLPAFWTLPLPCCPTADIIFFKLFKTTVGSLFSHSSIFYTHKQLLALRHHKLIFTDKLEIPDELRRRWRGCQAGVKRWKRARSYNPCLPAIVMGNFSSLSNKMDKLMGLTRLQWDYQECSIMCFRESWLNADIVDSVVFIKGFTLLRANQRTPDSRKRKG